MQTSLSGIAKKAKQNKEHRFGNLYGMLNKEALLQAWKDINRKAATGVDRETATEFGRNLEANIDTLVEELKSKRYKARLVKRVYIPKGKGRLRPLGLPTVSTNYTKTQSPFGKFNHHSPVSSAERAML